MVDLELKSNLMASLSDDESKFIFEQRHKYNKSGDYIYIANMCDKLYYNRYGVLLSDILKQQIKQNKYIIAFGTGAIGSRTAHTIKAMGIKLDFFCDNSNEKWGNKCEDIEIISPEKLKYNIGKCFILITTSIPTYMYQIKQQIIDMGFNDDDILLTCSILGNQYFDDLISFENNIDSFVDAGCYNADDTLKFISNTKNQYSYIYAFEPDEKNYKSCKMILKNYSNIDLSNFALSNTNEKKTFNFLNNGSSRLSNTGEYIVCTTKLDDYLDGKQVSYIKMDIEGAELNALKGSVNTIKKYAPNLAICVYHKKSDIYKILDFLYNLVPDYKLYFRHYSLCDLETVLYAIK